MAVKSVGNKNGEWKFTTIIRINLSISRQYDFNRTAKQHLLLYIFYMLQISLLWTNCVISSVAAAQNLEIKRNDKTAHDLLQYQSNESNMDSNLENRAESEHSLGNRSMANESSVLPFDSIKFLSSNSSETTTRILSMDSKAFVRKRKNSNRNERSRKLEKLNYLKHLTLSHSQISLNSSVTRNKRNQFRIKKNARKNVIHNLLFRNKIKRNVNNSSTYLLFNSSFNDENVSILSTSSASETFTTEPSLSSNNNSSNLNASNEIDTAITNRTTQIIAALSNVTLETIRNKTNSNDNHTIIKPLTTKQPPNYQQLNRYKVNNVFEMARKLKYNKLLTKNLSGPNESSSSNSSNFRSSDSNNTNTKGTVSVLGLFELSTRHGIRPEGYSELAAAQMAVRHINQRGLLPGYTLQLLTNDTKVRFIFD